MSVEGEAGDAERFDAARVRAALEAWFAGAARDLPWREDDGGRRDAYRVLVSEAMLQQTQVSRVVGKFEAFVERFPTVGALAAADEGDVLAMWSGLGYYRRARNLHAAAREVVERFGGEMPRDAASLMELKGVGRYTAGAVASLAYGERAPVVDGNVRRVIRRLACDDRAVEERAAERDDWRDAERLVEASASPGVVNEALIELGATVCTPRSPGCAGCPVRGLCGARRAGREGEIPPAKRAAARRDVWHGAALVTDGRGRVLLERRGEGGLWAGMWQPPAVESDERSPARAAVEAAVGVKLGSRAAMRFTHETTHRRVRFVVWRGVASDDARARRGAWFGPDGVGELAVANPHRRMVESALGGG